MKRYIAGLLLISVLLTTACTKNFDSVFSDPEALKNTAAGFFLNEILYDGANIGLRQSLTINNELVQVMVSKTETKEIHRYIIRTAESDYAWQNYYTVLNNIKDMRAAARRDKYVNCEAISLVLWAWIFQNLTDTYGDIPYREALNGYPDYQLRNKFDRQSFIYEDLVNKLDTANNMFVTNKMMEIGNDIMYHSHDTTGGYGYRTNRWKKLGNSIRLRLLMRIAHKSPEARAQINMILSNPTKYPVMTAVDETASVRYTGEVPFVNPYATARTIDWNGNRGMAMFFIDSLNSWSDPRLAKWASTTSGQFIGIPGGYSREEQDVVASTPCSTILEDLKSSSLVGEIMQYAEVEFIRAEAILRGYTTGDAVTAYQNGIKASFSYWGAAVPSDFFTRPGIAYNGTLHQVLFQKYFALFLNDTQQWAEIRRSGYPVLPKGTANAGKELPSRLQYPLLVQTANAANYQEAVANMGGDETTTKMWWQQ